MGSGHTRKPVMLQSRENTTFPFDFTVSRYLDPTLFTLVDSIAKECKQRGKIVLKLDLLFQLNTIVPRKVEILADDKLEILCN
jgi:hypothetical protein